MASAGARTELPHLLAGNAGAARYALGRARAAGLWAGSGASHGSARPADMTERKGRRLWQPPRGPGEQRQRRVVGPLELFYDLVVVVLVGQAAHHLTEHLSWSGVGEFAAVFALVWIAWLNGTVHHELHGREDARTRVLVLVQIFVLVPLGAFIPKVGGANGARFAIDAGILFAVLAIIWMLAGRRYPPGWRVPNRLYVTMTAGCAVVLLASAFLSPGARLLVWGLLAASSLVEVAVVIALFPQSQPEILWFTDALRERFALLVIIVLGEVVAGVVTGLSDEPISALNLSVALVAVLVGFGAWWTYFDFAGHYRPRRTRVVTVQWMFTHLPLTGTVAAMGAAMVSLVEHAHDLRTPAATAWVLCAGVAIVLSLTMLLVTGLEVWHRDRGRYLPVVRTCLVMALAAVALGPARPTPLVLAVVLVVLLGIPWVVAVARRAALDNDTARP
ncbi:low temperature requirement protein A [Streptomyces sp. NPDC001852]|uniref:low temperature requirement protein A n=1 Tax=Streptomyces sp. NPDC001852 TaxID=3364619 RepID=UPI0036892A9B